MKRTRKKRGLLEMPILKTKNRPHGSVGWQHRWTHQQVFEYIFPDNFLDLGLVVFLYSILVLKSGLFHYLSNKATTLKLCYMHACIRVTDVLPFDFPTLQIFFMYSLTTFSSFSRKGPDQKSKGRKA